jgi:hypothetical protein
MPEYPIALRLVMACIYLVLAWRYRATFTVVNRVLLPVMIAGILAVSLFFMGAVFGGAMLAGDEILLSDFVIQSARALIASYGVLLIPFVWLIILVTMGAAIHIVCRLCIVSLSTDKAKRTPHFEGDDISSKIDRLISPEAVTFSNPLRRGIDFRFHAPANTDTQML